MLEPRRTVPHSPKEPVFLLQLRARPDYKSPRQTAVAIGELNCFLQARDQRVFTEKPNFVQIALIITLNYSIMHFRSSLRFSLFTQLYTLYPTL
jgi:hypothetical protein